MKWFALAVAIIMVSCNGRGDRPRGKVNVSKPAQNIEQRSEQQIEIAKDAADISPEVGSEMDEIIDLSKYNIEDAQVIQSLQEKVDDNEKALVTERKAHKETKENLEKAHKNTLVKILGILVVAGLIALAGGIGLIAFTFYTQQKFSKMGLIVAVSGGAIAGLAIFTIYYLKTIAITVGIMVLLVIVTAIIKAIAMSRAQKDAQKHKKIAEELIDTFEDDRTVAKGKHSLDTKMMVTMRKNGNA